MRRKASRYLREEVHRSEALQASPSFSLVTLAKKYDDWFLDPIVGFLIPGVGDAISSIVILPSLYVAAFKLHSLKLTIAILYCMLIDLVCGLVPVFGDLVDAFYKSNKKVHRLIIGYVEDDEDVKSEINHLATWGLVVLAIVSAVAWLIYKLAIWLWDSISSMF